MKYDLAKDVDETVKEYFKSLRDFKPLSKKEEHELLTEYKINHSISARNKLINSNLRYACKLASSYRNRGISYSDLISEANSGLIEAIEKFDLSKDVKLISYSKWWIMQKIQYAIDKKSKIPISELPSEDDSPTTNEDEESMMNSESSHTKDDTFITEIEVDENENDIKGFVENILSALEEREIDMVDMYFGRNGYREFTLDEIGKKYKLTKERVRQIIESAFKKIRGKSILIDSKYLSR